MVYQQFSDDTRAQLNAAALRAHTAIVETDDPIILTRGLEDMLAALKPIFLEGPQNDTQRRQAEQIAQTLIDCLEFVRVTLED